MTVSTDEAILPELEPYECREFLPADFSLDSWQDLEPYFDRLYELIDSAETVEDLEDVLRRYSELDVVAYEEYCRRYVRMTCRTANEIFEEAYLDYEENIQPRLKEANHEFHQRLTEHPKFDELPEETYNVFKRSVENFVELFREENVPLETEVSKLSQKYQKLTGSLTVEFDGEEKTLQQMRKYLEELGRDVRQDAWKTAREKRYEHRDEFAGLFDELQGLRLQIAKNAGFDDYRQYIFREKERFDYTPEDCYEFHAAVEDHIVPLKEKIQTIRRDKLDLDRLRPWDTSVNLFEQPPLEVYESADELVDIVSTLLGNVEPEIEDFLRKMHEKGTLSLINRKGKAPGGYQIVFKEARIPFVFMNGVGRHRGVKTLLHESGHAVHTFLCRDEMLSTYRETTAEFAETASMSMELFGGEYLDEIYSEVDARRVRVDKLESLINLFPWVARVDRFQHEIYQAPPSADRRREVWRRLNDRFAGIVDWSGYEDYRNHSWHSQLHVFQYPFYYVEYGIAQLAAVQLWQRFLADKQQALDDYKNALSLGGSRPLPELFEAADLDFDFSAQTIEPIAEFLDDQIDRLLG